MKILENSFSFHLDYKSFRHIYVIIGQKKLYSFVYYSKYYSFSVFIVQLNFILLKLILKPILYAFCCNF